MRKFYFALSASTALVCGAMICGLPASATPGSPQGLRAAGEEIGIIEQAANIFGGHKHCWYEKGWHGAGWYWCGYGNRKGRGWGGEEGWNGWHH